MMDNAVRKLNLIKWLSDIEDDSILKKVEALAKDSLEANYRRYAQPQTDEELEQLIQESEEAYKAENHSSHEDVKKRFRLDK